MHGCKSLRNSPNTEFRHTVGRVKVIGAMETPDGAWRVEIVKRGGGPSYQIRHDGVLIEYLPIAAVIRILGEAGVDMADLVEVKIQGAA